MDWTTEESMFDSLQKKDIFLGSAPSRPAVGPTQPSIEWIQGLPPTPESKEAGAWN
jgi:hypothetical protein